MAAPGSIVAWWREGELAFAVVVAEEKQKLRLVGPDGREDRVPPLRIAFAVEPSGHPPGPGPDERAAAARRAAAAAERARLGALAVDVPSLWEVACETGGEHRLADLADLALGGDEPAALAATAWALVSDDLHFVRRGEAWVPRTAAATAEIRMQRRREAERTEERERAVGALSAAARGEGWAPSGSAFERRVLDAVEQLALLDEAAGEPQRGLALETLDAAGVRGDRPSERAFRLLRAVGRFASDDENLAILRFGLRTAFPPEVEEAAAEAARRGWSRERREDLTGLEVLTVDGPRTREIDDGVSLEALGGGRFRLGIHIADPAAFVEPGDPVDAEALLRATSHYLPDAHLPMLPRAISEQAASLVAGEERPALSFLAVVDEDGAVVSFRATRAALRVGTRLDYDAADAILRSGEGPQGDLLRALSAVTDALRARRGRAGAVLLDAEEVEVRREEDGTLRLERLDPRSPSRRLVSEAMILAGALAARLCVEHRVPAIFRRQAAPAALPSLPGGEPLDPATVRAVRRALRRGETGLEPGPHFALGLEAYAQASSPLRRYQDLALHRQIASVLEGKPPLYAEEEMRRIAAATERAEADGRQAERSSDGYWLLRYLEASGAQVVEAVVVDVQPAVVQLRETLIEARVPGLTGAAPGESLRLRVERINPRADLLILRPVLEGPKVA